MSKKKILLIDTEKNILLAYQSLLQQEGYLVEITSTEKSALEMFATNDFALVITELYLKGKSTLNMIKQIKQEYPSTYIIMTSSALLDPEDSSMVINHGVDDFFAKPISGKGLLANINKGLTRRAVYLRNIELEKKVKNHTNLSLNNQFHMDSTRSLRDHQSFNKRLQEELLRSRRYNHSFSLLLFNIYDFNNNQIESHNKKQTSLEETYQILLKKIRNTDIVSTYNGNCALILVETPKNGALIVKNRFKEELTNVDINYLLFPEDAGSITKWIDEHEN